MATLNIDPRLTKPIGERLTALAIEEVGGGGVDLPINISDVTELQSELDSKANTIHTHTIANVTGLQAALDSKGTSNLTIGTTASTAMAGNTPIPSLPIAISDVTGLQDTLTSIVPPPPDSGGPYVLTCLGNALSWEPYP